MGPWELVEQWGKDSSFLPCGLRKFIWEWMGFKYHWRSEVGKYFVATLLDRGSQFLAMPSMPPPHASALFFGPLGHLLVVQLTLGQHGFGPHGSTYAWIFSVVNTTALNTQVGWSCRWGTAGGECGVKGFSTEGRVQSLIFIGSRVNCSHSSCFLCFGEFS